MLGCFCFMLLRAAAGEPEPVQAPEPEVKAAFLYNFTKLVTWPKAAFASNSAPFVIGVLGKDPFGKQLDNMLANRIVAGRRLLAVRLKPGDPTTNCHVLFVSESERRRFDLICSDLADKPVLTVGDVRGFAAHGMIELIKTNEMISLSINLPAAKGAGLALSSHLTRLDRTLRPSASTSTNTPPQPPPLRP